MKIYRLLLVIIMPLSTTVFSADFDIGVNIQPVASPKLPKRRSLSNKEKNQLKAKVAQRYDLPENWLNLMNQNQLYYLEIQERALDQNINKPKASKLNRAKGE